MSDEQNYKDPLERLFRKKAGEYNISYREEDWLKLEKQLDAHDMKLYYRRRLRWLAVASILFLSLIGYYTIQNHNKINQLTEQLNQNEAIQQNDLDIDPQQMPALAKNDSNESPSQAEVAEESIDSGALSESETAGGNQEQNGLVNNNEESIAAIAEDDVEQVEGLLRRTIGEATQMIRERSVEPNQLFPNRSSILASFHTTNEPVELSERGSYGRYQTYNRDSGNGSSAMLSSPISVSNEFVNNQYEYPEDSRLAVGVVLSPDLSTVGGISNFYDPGFKGGVLAEYSLSENISLISGITLSNVKYIAEGQVYDPPQYWNSGVMPDETRAVCVVLDIPLNVKANIFNFNRSRIFATAGLSSYIMLNEDYQFRYNNSNQTGLQTSWNEATGTRHWFSNAGFSIGIEYDLSPSWSLRAEPHIKVPLKGVGWGDVELYSIGNFVSLNYRFSM